jgi:hypothetical protein
VDGIERRAVVVLGHVDSRGGSRGDLRAARRSKAERVSARTIHPRSTKRAAYRVPSRARLVYVRGQGRLLAPILFGAPFADSIWDATLVASHILRNGKCEPAPIPTFRATHRKLGCTDTHAQLDQRWADLHRQYGPIVHGEP